ncbi:MAG: aldehyde dehydrogenase family protein [candidate division Zixibacteria bacterium]|nr:aldehyde dehydrogenase family protein [candidate division Zixibacteria bacterium]
MESPTVREHSGERLFIGGAWVSGENFLPVIDKFTGRPLTSVPTADEELVEMAVRSAEAGFAAMKVLPALKRSEILEKISGALREAADEFAAGIIAEAGKPAKFARQEVERSIQTFKFAAEEAKRLHGETVPLDAQGGSEKKFGFYHRFPIGVVAAITPFNFPLNLAAHKLAPALAAGCSVILKPSSLTPLTALKLAKLVEASGAPAGAFNVLVGSGGTVGDWLVSHPNVAMVTFTGSAEVGKQIREKAGLKKTLLELGNNSAAIVDETADLDWAAQRCAAGAFAYSGQVCISLQRIYVEKSAAKPFTEKLVALAKNLKVGDPKLGTTDIGPLISEPDARRVEDWINEAKAAGMELKCGGRRKEAFYEPTVLFGDPSGCRIGTEELFGPAVTVTPYEKFEQAVEAVNSTPYGLQAAIFTRNLNRAFAAFRELEVGGVIINDSPSYRADFMPYGGVKESGSGREGVRFAIEEMTYLKMAALHLSE